MRLIDADALKQHIDKLPALPDGNFAGNHSALKALINMQPTIEQPTNCSEFPNNSDTISRQEAIDVIDKIFPADPMRNDYTQGITCGAALATEYIKQLPSAQQKRKKGRWKRLLVDSGFNADWYCSECGWKTAIEEHGYNYCPHCGADMRRMI